jgi:inhibitor of KinA sporulation pathway (predicted exonuclease)
MIFPGLPIQTDVVVVFDLEFTSWEGARQRWWQGEGEYREIVQIGAVKLGSDGLPLSEFEVLVRPSINPQLSEYFSNLTAIHQAAVDRYGVTFREGVEGFAAFLGGETTAVVSFGGDAMVLHENCGLHRITCPVATDLFFDLKPWICAQLDLDWRTESADLAPLLGHPAPGRRHNALDDARSLAVALRQISRLEE